LDFALQFATEYRAWRGSQDLKPLEMAETLRLWDWHGI
jgi:hypothetical protein